MLQKEPSRITKRSQISLLGSAFQEPEYNSARLTLRLPARQKRALERMTRKVQDLNDLYTIADICRVALARLERSYKNGGRRWLIAEIERMKGGHGSEGDAGISGVSSLGS